MPKSNDLSIIKWQMRMMEEIPVGDGVKGISVDDLRKKVAPYMEIDEGDSKADVRRIQRTLKAIKDDPEWGDDLICCVEGPSGFMVEVDLTSDQQNRKKQYWKWKKTVKRIPFPGMGIHEALTLLMVQAHIVEELPPATRFCLEPYFEAAKKRIDGAGPGSLHSKWLKKIASRPPNQPLVPAKINPKVHDAVLTALHDERQLEIKYRGRGKGVSASYTVHPLGIIMRGPVTYLVCTINSYPDVRLLALHRITSASPAEAKASTAGFSLKKYLAEGGGDFSCGGLINLEVMFDFEVGEHLEANETQLTHDQTLELVGSRYCLKANIPDTHQLRWWLIGFGPRAEVIKPVSLRKWIAQEHRSAASLYG